MTVDFKSTPLNPSPYRRGSFSYVEPGGYYEYGVEFDKPVVACIVGRWKARLTRAVGHAGAMAGSGDRAEDKEQWFMDNFGVTGVFTPERRIASAKVAVVTNIAHIPAALSAVMALNNLEPDFEKRGSLSLKPWLVNDQGLKLPQTLALQTHQVADNPNGGAGRAEQNAVFNRHIHTFPAWRVPRTAGS